MSKPYTKRITIQYHETASHSAVEITEEELEENTGWWE